MYLVDKMLPWLHSPLCSMDGIRRDQTEAAIITPEANPRNARFMVSLTAPRKQKTTAAPKDVIKNVKPVPTVLPGIFIPAKVRMF